MWQCLPLPTSMPPAFWQIPAAGQAACPAPAWPRAARLTPGGPAGGSALALRALSPPLALMTAQETALSGAFRNAHQARARPRRPRRGSACGLALQRDQGSGRTRLTRAAAVCRTRPPHASA